VSSLLTSQKTQLRAESFTLSLQAAWIGFNPDSYDGTWWVDIICWPHSGGK